MPGRPASRPLYPINVIPLCIVAAWRPPRDIPPPSDHFLAIDKQQVENQIVAISHDAMDLLTGRQHPRARKMSSNGVVLEATPSILPRQSDPDHL
jgi:hypothetical protein